MTTFADKLTQMFEQIEPEFRATTLENYKNRATNDLESWLKLLDGPQPVGREGLRLRMPQYVTTTGGSYSLHWPRLQEDRRRGLFVADYVSAERDATRAVDFAKQHFVGKQTKKLTNATKNHAGQPKIGGYLKFDSGIITGALVVKYDNGDEFVVSMSIITNHRYEKQYTSFHQFPARFGGVKLKGEAVKGRISEIWMETNFK